MLKPWTVATNIPSMWRAFAQRRCPGCEVHPYHLAVEGEDTKKATSHIELPPKKEAFYTSLAYNDAKIIKQEKY